MITSIPVSGTIGSNVDVTLIVTGFKNPASTCDVIFVCKGGSNEFPLPYTATPETLSSI